MKFFIILVASVVSFGASAVECSGPVSIQGSEHNSEAILTIDKVEVGAIFNLSQPIVHDLTATVSFKMIAVESQPSGGTHFVRSVVAVPTPFYGSGVMTFTHVLNTSDDTVIIADLKGFEGESAYGPSDLVCR